jgi:hypothetical protein
MEIDVTLSLRLPALGLACALSAFAAFASAPNAAAAQTAPAPMAVAAAGVQHRIWTERTCKQMRDFTRTACTEFARAIR